MFSEIFLSVENLSEYYSAKLPKTAKNDSWNFNIFLIVSVLWNMKIDTKY